MTVRLLDSCTGDFAPLAALHAACFAEPWTQKAIGDLLATPNCYTFATYSGRTAGRKTARDGGPAAADPPPLPLFLADAPDGFIIARAAAGEAEILTLAVIPRARGRGLGRMLVTAAADHARGLGATAMFLEVASDNQAALALYDRVGFVRVAERRGYYAGADALVLKAPLPLSPDRNIA